MYNHHPTILSANDYARLQGLMCTLIGSPEPLAALLRHKLGSALIMLPSDAGPDLVTSARRVRYTIDGSQSAEQTLTWERPARGNNSTLSLRTPRGLALLGLRIGDTLSYRTYNGRTEHLTVEFVFSGNDEHSSGGFSAGTAPSPMHPARENLIGAVAP